MRLTRIVAAGVMVSSVALTVASAQINRDLTVPAEFPPSNFEGMQYVDSRGCVYIRAGFDGNVNWVPRMTRAREVMCGSQPSLPSGQGSAVAQTQRTEATPVQIVPEEMPDGTPLAAQAPATPQETRQIPRLFAAPAARVIQPDPEPVETVAAPTDTAPVTTIASTTTPPVTVAPRRQGGFFNLFSNRRAPAPAPLPTPLPQPAAEVQLAQASGNFGGGCQGATPLSTEYLQLRQPGSVRCGPQTIPPVGKGVENRTPEGEVVPYFPGQRAYPGGPVYVPGVGGTTTYAPNGAPVYIPNVNSGLVPNGREQRLVPRHVYQQRAESHNVDVPEGYEAVWTDGRLNPYRAAQTASGIASTQQIWTNTVPRRLVDPTKFPVRYTPVVVGSGRLRAPEYDQAPNSLNAATQPTRLVISTRNELVEQDRFSAKAEVPLYQQPANAAGPRYVQAGAFVDDMNARAAAQHLAARSEQPVRLGTLVRGGAQYRIVVMGPFMDDAEIRVALGTARSAGYTGAYVR